MNADLVDKAATVIHHRPLLINMVSKRVRQLNSGRHPLIDRAPGMGMADVALLEIIEGKVIVAENEDEIEEV